MFRQGDVLIVPVKEVPAEAKPIAHGRGRLVLAYGEATGHAHVVEGKAELLVADLEDLERRFLRVKAEARVVHDEHDALILPPGDYEIRRQREYSPEANRWVAD